MGLTTIWFRPVTVPTPWLMETDAAENDRPVVYAGPHEKARSIYIQPGHSAQTMRDPGFRRLVRNALYWVARQEVLP